MLTMVAHGYPIAAIEAAFGLQRRTVQGWVEAAGEHCEQIHEHLVLKPRELGGAISPSRDTALIRRLVVYVRACASVERPLSVATDGLITYLKAFRSKRYTGRVGAPRLIAWPEVVIGQVLKRYKRRT